MNHHAWWHSSPTYIVYVEILCVSHEKNCVFFARVFFSSESKFFRLRVCHFKIRMFQHFLTISMTCGVGITNVFLSRKRAAVNAVSDAIFSDATDALFCGMRHLGVIVNA